MPKPFSPSEAGRLRDFLAQVNYTDAEFRSQPALCELPSLHAGNWPYLLDRTQKPSALNALLRLFLFGMRQEASAIAAAVPPGVLDLLLSSGMLVPDADELVPAVMLTPLDQYWFAADPLWRMESDQSADVVLWANQTTRMLHGFSTRRPSADTLDLGSGCGVLSVLASSYSRRVAATDLNPRAAEFTRFNAALNGATNVECYTGDTYDPVGEQTFDTILANPPFFVTPSSTQLYCENPMELDGFCRRVVREGAARLNEGGYLQMTFEWVTVCGERWQDRIAGWLEGTGCDAWVMRGYVRDPAAYAYERTKDQYPAAPERTTKKFSAWVSYYRGRKVEEISGGVMAMRRRTGKNWLRIEEVPLEDREPFGASVPEVFDTQTVLAQHVSDETLIALKPRLAPDARLDQQSRVQDARWEPCSLRLSLGPSLPTSMAVEFAVADFLARCDGKRSLGELVTELAGTVRAPEAQVRAQCCAVVRKLAERRFLRLRPVADCNPGPPPMSFG